MRIAKIIDVVDTRDWQEEADEVWRPIPNSGDEHECERCGRMHEIHGHVELEDGTGAIVGTGCMRADDMTDGVRPATLANRAKRAKQLASQIGAWEARLSRIAEIETQVSAMRAPQITVSKQGERIVFTCGDAECFSFCGELSDERRKERETCALSLWHGNRMKDLGVKPYEADCLRSKLSQAKKEIGRCASYVVNP